MTVSWERRTDAALREEVFSADLPGGLEAHFLPRPRFLRKTCVLAIRFGSLDGAFVPPGAPSPVEAPPGLAHFLEHRVFTTEQGDAFDLFAALGASSNAATSFGSTSFYFSCVENFAPCLEILLGFLKGLPLTEEMVDRERSIIAEEIRGMSDHPDWLGYHNLMEALFVESPGRHDIGGTLDSVARINADLLRSAYRTFYVPANAAVFASGDLDPAQLEDAAAAALAGRDEAPAPRRILAEEPRTVARRSCRAAMRVSLPKIFVGFKENGGHAKGPALARRTVETNIALSAVFGRASDFFRDGYAAAVLDESFHASHHGEPGFGFTTLSGDTEQPDRLLERIFEAVERARRHGASSDDVERILKRIRGRFLRAFNHPETAAFNLMHHALQGTRLLDFPAVLDSVTLEGVNRRIMEHLDPATHARSVVLPL